MWTCTLYFEVSSSAQSIITTYLETLLENDTRADVREATMSPPEAEAWDMASNQPRKQGANICHLLPQEVFCTVFAVHITKYRRELRLMDKNRLLSTKLGSKVQSASVLWWHSSSSPGVMMSSSGPSAGNCIFQARSELQLEHSHGIQRGTGTLGHVVKSGEGCQAPRANWALFMAGKEALKLPS